MKLNTRTPILAIVLVAGLLAGGMVLTSAPPPAYGPGDAAFYASEAEVNFVRPGLRFTLSNPEIATDGTVKVRVKMTDPMGVPLDREGINTPGPISCSLILATIPNGATQYVSYTVRTQTSPITNKSAIQAAADSGGTWTKITDGDYTYTFRTKLPANYDKAATHTIGAYGNRNLSEFDFPNSYNDTWINWVPSGAAVTVTRDVIKTATCNKCHDGLALHGGSRRSMEVCNLCHTPQTTDPDTGRSVDMIEMTHKIHMGAALPSVQAGTPYVIIGNRQSVHDYSKVVFPADARRCSACHEQNTGAKQAKAFYNASRAACGACHDDVEFATGKNHLSIPMFDDKGCTRCHIPKGELDFDASIEGAHLIPRHSTSLPGVKFQILDVVNAKPGQRPMVVFVVETKAGRPVVASRMSRLRLYMTGPTADFTSYIQDDVRAAEGNGFGVYWWSMSQPIPATAKGSWAIVIEGRNEVVLLEGTARQRTARDTGANVMRTFSVDGSAPVPRRDVVDMAKCNACHGDLAFHGEARNRVEACVVCHNPAAIARTPQTTIEFGVMIHKIHRGHSLERGYVVGTDDYSHVGYPGDLRNCNACHIGDSQQLPLSKGQVAVVSPIDYISTAGRETAACLACHDTKPAAAHAAVNTDAKLGESCATCHGPTGSVSVNRVHAR